MALVLRFVPPLALMALIFFFSAQEDLSSGLGVWDTIGRKIVHMAEYGLLWFLWWRALGSGHPAPSMVITLLYAASDEFHQTFVEGRHGSPIDVADRRDGRRDRVAAGGAAPPKEPRCRCIMRSPAAARRCCCCTPASPTRGSGSRSSRRSSGSSRSFGATCPGFGRSPLPSGDWVNADEVAGVLDAAGIERASVVGNSYGGLVSIQLAARHPDRVERLVLFAPSLGLEPDPRLAAVHAEEYRLWDAEDIEGVVELNVRTWVQPDVPDESRRLVREMQRLAVELQSADPDAEPGDVDIDLAAIAVPVTVYTGGRDFETFERTGRVRAARRQPRGDQGRRRGQLARGQGDPDQDRRHERAAGDPDLRRRLRQQPRALSEARARQPRPAHRLRRKNGYLHQLWGHRVLLETLMKGKKTLLSYGEHGFDAKLMAR